MKSQMQREGGGGGGGENHFYFRYEQFSVHTCIIFEHHCMCVFLTFILTFKLITHLQRYFYGRMSFCMPVFKDFPYKFPYEILFAPIVAPPYLPCGHDLNKL